MIKLAVIGAGGRMGRRIVALAHESDDLQVVAALENAGSELLGQDAGELAGVGKIDVPISDKLAQPCDMVIDFSLPESTMKWVKHCHAQKIPMVIGTTGLSDEQVDTLKAVGKDMPILWAANMSLGVNLLFKLVGEVARSLGDDYDVEIVETHHRFKRDAPSGTALVLGRNIAAAKDRPWPGCARHGREGKEATRQPETIGMHAVRAGDVVGEHRVYFSALGETVELRHNAHTRDTFVRGALRAARWLAGQQSGMFGMADVLGL